MKATMTRGRRLVLGAVVTGALATWAIVAGVDDKGSGP